MLACASAMYAGPTLEKRFQEEVRPFVDRYCVSCHSGAAAAAQLDLKSFTSQEMVVRDFPHWALVMQRLEAREMPPKPLAAPPQDATQRVIAWIRAARSEEIARSAGDPGIVLLRRLSNAEYNYTIRDLTGEDLRTAREFPVDPANPAGFDNSGESLTMSPALLGKYLRAAREIADHMVLSPDSIDFAPFPAQVETDREKYAVQRIISFYKRQPTDYADYFRAAYRHKVDPGKTLASIAAESKISGRYLSLVWEILNEPRSVGPVLKLQKMFQGLRQDHIEAGCVEMREFVQRIRAHTAMQFAAPVVNGLPPGSQPLLHWKNRQFASHRRDSDPNNLRNDSDPPPAVPPIPKYPGLHRETAPLWAALSTRARANDADLIVPARERKRYETAFARFAYVFPDTFYVTERGRYFPDDTKDKGRLLSAGYHSVLGFFRDDQPLMELILDDAGRRELDRLWNEFDFIANFTARTWIQYFFNQSGEVEGRGAESASPRPVGHEVTDEAVILKLRDAYLAKAASDPHNDAIAAHAIREHFEGINATLRALEVERKNAEPKHLEALVRFAGRAYRRPVRVEERTDLLAQYRTLRSQRELSHQEAIRECLVSILVSPDFLYRMDLADHGDTLSRASRLSYFLWGSMPDEQLMRRASAGELREATDLAEEARRLMKDPRVEGFATEFLGNWLGFRHFENTNSVDRERFAVFTPELRDAMFQEPVQFFADMVRNNRSVLDLLYGNYTFVNSSLARHYGIPVAGSDWVKIEDARRFGRGGLLPMAVFLTQNSPGLRTSPVKRGNWVVKNVLGEVIPPPPPTVPELPNDEAKMDLPVRELLAKHRENAACAACHARFDSFGLAFEGYDPIGGARKKDLAGRPVHTKVEYPDGSERDGVEGLRQYIREHRQHDFVEQFSRKLLAYALNRSLQLSDEQLIAKMTADLEQNEYRIASAIGAIVSSPQFLNRRQPPRRTDVSPTAF